VNGSVFKNYLIINDLCFYCGGLAGLELAPSAII